jgi:hypothetical protein
VKLTARELSRVTASESMKTAFIVPTKFLRAFATKSDYHLTLAHKALADRKYSDFYKTRSKSGDFVICDNSAFELGKPIEGNRLLRAAELVGAKEIVCPDSLFDGKGTIRAVNNFIKNYVVPKGVGLMAVAQGANWRDFLNCYQTLNLMPEIQSIGLSFLGVEKALPDVSTTLSRLVALDILVNQGLAPTKPIHLLGMGDNPIELKLFRTTKLSKYIRGNDSSSAFVHGQHGFKFDPVIGLNRKKIKKKIDLELTALSDGQKADIRHNINVIKSWVKD